jgi:hypothetical protein
MFRRFPSGDPPIMSGKLPSGPQQYTLAIERALFNIAQLLKSISLACCHVSLAGVSVSLGAYIKLTNKSARNRTELPAGVLFGFDH